MTEEQAVILLERVDSIESHLQNLAPMLTEVQKLEVLSEAVTGAVLLVTGISVSVAVVYFLYRAIKQFF